MLMKQKIRNISGKRNESSYLNEILLPCLMVFDGYLMLTEK